jgi:hypothetical protein
MPTEIITTPNGDYTVTTNSSGSKQGSYSVGATVTRSIVTADVLDYDGYKGNYALIWKKITISHSQEQVTTASGSRSADYTNQAWGDGPQPITYGVTSNFTSVCTRQVDFYLTYKVNGQKVDKLICSCTIRSAHTNDDTESHSYEGTRVWGVSIQVKDDFIVYQFRKEVPAEKYKTSPVPPFGNGYDGCYGFESWMTDRDENDLWKLQSNVVGLINIADGVGSEVGYLKEEEYNVGEEGNSLSIGEVYSTGVVNKDTGG